MCRPAKREKVPRNFTARIHAEVTELERSSRGERDAVTHKITKPTTLKNLPETRDHATYWTLSGESVPRQRSLPERIRSDASVIPTLVAT